MIDIDNLSQKIEELLNIKGETNQTPKTNAFGYPTLTHLSSQNLSFTPSKVSLQAPKYQVSAGKSMVFV